MPKKTERLVGKRELVKVEGMKEALDKIQATLDRATGLEVKDVFIDGAKPIWSKAKHNIQGLPISNRLKQILDAEVMIFRAKPKQPYVVVGVSQGAGIKKLGDTPGRWKGKAFIINPYWVEYGIRGRSKGAYSGHPFFRPALASARESVKEALANGFKEILVTRNDG